jgi:hypothetical protein
MRLISHRHVFLNPHTKYLTMKHQHYEHCQGGSDWTGGEGLGLPSVKLDMPSRDLRGLKTMQTHFYNFTLFKVM